MSLTKYCINFSQMVIQCQFQPRQHMWDAWMESLSIVLLCLLFIILNWLDDTRVYGCMINARTPGVSAFDNVKLLESKSLSLRKLRHFLISKTCFDVSNIINIIIIIVLAVMLAISAKLVVNFSKIWAPCLNIVCISLTLILCLHLYYTAPKNASPFELKLSHFPLYMLHTVDPAFVLLPMLVNFLWSCSSHIYFIQVHQTSLISLLIKLLMRETT